MMQQVLKLIEAIRSSHPDMVKLYTEGQCYQFYLILRSQWPDAKAYYSRIEGHVYTMIDFELYDIRGRWIVHPKDLELLDHNTSYPPYRWGRGDQRQFVLTDNRKQIA